MKQQQNYLNYDSEQINKKEDSIKRLRNCIVTINNQVDDNNYQNRKNDQEMEKQMELEIQQLEKWKKCKKFYKEEYDKQNI